MKERETALPVGEMVDLLRPPLNLGLEVDELPEVMPRHVLHRGGLHLHLRHRDQHLESQTWYSNIQYCVDGILLS
jgi:hypothetical protein